MLRRLASSCFRHPRRVLGGWLLLLVVAVGVGQAAGGTWLTADRLPGTDSQKAYDVLARNLPAKDAQSDSVVFSPVAGHNPAVTAFLQQAAQVPGVVTVGPLQMAPRGSPVGRAELSLAVGHPAAAAATTLEQRARALQRQGVTVAFSGDAFSSGSVPSSEIIGILAALVVLVIAFGSLIAAGPPILVALLGIGVAIPGVQVLSHLVGMADFTTQVVAMIGIGVGIDYSLLILTRYRTARAAGRGHHDAAVEAVGRAGRAVVLAGATVMVSSLGMMLIGMATFTGLAVGLAFGVAVAVAAGLTLLPAMIALLGDRLDAGRGRGRRRGRVGAGGRVGGGARWAAVVTRRPRQWALAALVVAVVLAVPFARLHLGQPGAATDPAGSTTRTAYHLTASAFGPGTEGPILVVVDGPGVTRGGAGAVAATVAKVAGVASVGPVQTSPSGRVAVFEAVPTTGPASPATEHLLRHLRHDVVPAMERSDGVAVHLGGDTASSIDFAAYTAQRLPLFVGAVLAISMLLLMVMLRSVLVPLKAVVLNLVSVAASFGVIVAVFQWGWGTGLLGTSAAPIAPWIPVMVFAIVFGLSMDYEVFLVSAIRESWDGGAGPRLSVITGMASTSRLITAAATIMVLVFGSFATSNLVALKVLGVGLAVAIAFDATVVRLVLAPSIMTVLGKWTWWMPGRAVRPEAPADELPKALRPRAGSSAAGSG
ncbi:MMPL family transporter [Acidiferrimicrobium sp. IK]|uniref:MMPL family transporter n=1 Tax=Acidiferrimicrobium sp. IK TaxID=2871700 RepID=UPI0021CB4B3D|nr:MMPL family transporter [Acidiferrimicrobium sp. IK]MCU4184771.1 MMPL family transporter [Acidiferrimicrobium sp. IK]